ncbi:MAG: hypothetical protein IPJ81_06925 [Chitinophagaceae bacterium]|nr:hypothetical protein [Chitinophagaceae bacterium]
MAQIITVSTYATGPYDSGSAMGFSKGFPVQNIFPEQITPETRSGVVCNATITLLPTGLNVNGKKFYTAMTLAQIITASNA